MKLSRFWPIIAIIIAVTATIALFNLFSNFHPIMSDKINLTTSDNVKIAADFYKAEQPEGWLILIHMMPSTKESWREFAEAVQKQGYESLAIDLRGHGDSLLMRTEIKLDYRRFSDEEHQKSILDLKAAVDYLVKNRKATPEKIAFIGASIGANLVLQFINKNPEFKKAVLLSPGLDYRGIKTLPLIREIKNDQSILFATSKDDGNNAEENRQLYDAAPAKINKHLIVYEGGGHGTNMFNNTEELNLTETIKKFLENGTIY